MPAFHATALRHPAAAELHTASFVPNDVHLGGNDGVAPFIVLTGRPRSLCRGAGAVEASPASEMIPLRHQHRRSLDENHDQTTANTSSCVISSALGLHGAPDFCRVFDIGNALDTNKCSAMHC